MKVYEISRCLIRRDKSDNDEKKFLETFKERTKGGLGTTPFSLFPDKSKYSMLLAFLQLDRANQDSARIVLLNRLLDKSSRFSV